MAAQYNYKIGVRLEAMVYRGKPFALASIAIITSIIAVALYFIFPQENAIPRLHSVGILLFGDSRLDQVNGFMNGLADLGYIDGSNIEYHIRNADNQRDKLHDLTEGLINLNVGLLVAAGGLEVEAMRPMAIEKNIPVVLLYSNAIIERGLVKSRREPGWNVTGIDNLNAELSGKRIELIRDLLPDVKTILILYDQRIPPSRIGVETAQKAANKLGLQIDAREVSSPETIRQVMVSLKPGDVDAMLTVPTASIDNALREVIVPRVNELKIPLMTHSRSLAGAGALASYGAAFYDMGQQAARLADKVLKGLPAGKMPFETPKTILYSVNLDVVNQFELTLTDVTRSQVNEYVTTKY